ncbi:hypothetical protein BJ166DRAFT_589669 [Pestalotiopsis sp. NC0098]|nr:hypothetical protein BJ166DRAFT_589669 [Pestalotiopsis sp. NC0098]
MPGPFGTFGAPAGVLHLANRHAYGGFFHYQRPGLLKPVFVITLLALVAFCVNFGSVVSNISLAAIIESSLCDGAYGQGTSETYSEPCTSPFVQDDVTLVTILEGFTAMIPATLFCIIYGSIADNFGRK